MNIRELQYLVAVEKHRHFRKAAESCFVSQPTLSGQLKKLEQELGVLLVERSSRQVVMTEVGRAVASQARKVLAELNAVRDIAQAFADPMAGQIHLGLIPTIGPYLLPVIMAPMHHQFPKLKLWLHEYQTAILLEKLHDAELDVLIIALPTDTRDFKIVDLYREPFRLALPRGSSLAKKAEVTLSDISNTEMMLLEQGHCLREHALDVCRVAGARENTGYHASSVETLRHMVGEGMGMTLIPELAVPEKPRKTDLVRYIPFADPKPTRRIVMLYRRNNYREETLLNLAELIRVALPVRVFF